jgi:hypothetical protein
MLPALGGCKDSQAQVQCLDDKVYFNGTCIDETSCTDASGMRFMSNDGDVVCQCKQGFAMKTVTTCTPIADCVDNFIHDLAGECVPVCASADKSCTACEKDDACNQCAEATYLKEGVCTALPTTSEACTGVTAPFRITFAKDGTLSCAAECPHADLTPT